MKVHVKLDITDEQRNIMHNLITGKDTKQMVSRAMVVDFVQGAIDAVTEIVDDGEAPAPIQHTPKEVQLIEHLRKKGHNDSYIRGQLQVVRRLAGRKAA